MKKIMALGLALLLVFAVTVPEGMADAKPRFGGSYKSPRRSYTPPAQRPSDGVSKTEPGRPQTTTPGAGAARTNRGFFSGGGLMRGLLVGGLAGMLFGGIFANMGMMGNILGLFVNLLGLYLLFVIIRGIVRYFGGRGNSGRKRYE